jgi:hypothetical protein
MNISENSVWLYTGPAPGKNMPHKVVMRCKNAESNTIEITTWSVFDKDPNNGGYSWNGTEADFLKNFQPAQLV